MISGDKGNNNPEQFRGLMDPHIAVHGSFSVMVNYHAIGAYFTSRGGFALHNPQEEVGGWCHGTMGWRRRKHACASPRFEWRDCTLCIRVLVRGFRRRSRGPFEINPLASIVNVLNESNILYVLRGLAHLTMVEITQGPLCGSQRPTSTDPGSILTWRCPTSVYLRHCVPLLRQASLKVSAFVLTGNKNDGALMHVRPTVFRGMCG